MIINSDIFEFDAALNTAKKMAAAARTAPKACGEDSIFTAILTGEELLQLADKTIELGIRDSIDFFVRDGNLLKKSHCVVIIGVEKTPLGLTNCGFCGFENCGKCAKANGHCALKLADLGIALGSAVSIAADCRIDNRIAYSLGKAALALGMFPAKVTNAYCIPLATSGKSIFFDREAVQQK